MVLLFKLTFHLKVSSSLKKTRFYINESDFFLLMLFQEWNKINGKRIEQSFPSCFCEPLSESLGHCQGYFNHSLSCLKAFIRSETQVHTESTALLEVRHY